jgi:hypothetical protein
MCKQVKYIGLFFGFISIVLPLKAQRVNKFEDRDLEKIVATVLETPENEKSKSGVLPAYNSLERVKFLSDSIQKLNAKIKYAEGFRIQLYLGINKEEANKVKEQMYKLMPNADLYALYKQPVYKIKLGDFTDRLEANRMLFKTVKKSFPNAIVVADNVLIGK